MGALEAAGIGGAHTGVKVGDKLHRIHITDGGGAVDLIIEEQPGDPHGGKHPLLADDVLGAYQKFHHHVVAHRKGDDLLDGLRVHTVLEAVRKGFRIFGHGLRHLGKVCAVLIFRHDSSSLCIVIGRGGVIKAVVADAGDIDPHLAGEVGAAGGAVGVEEPQGLPQIDNPPPCHGPLGNLVLNVLRAHIIDVLLVGLSPHRLHGAGELTGLEDDLPDAPLAHAGVFPGAGTDPVHHHTGHRRHAGVPLPAGFALDEPCQKLQIGKCHLSSIPSFSLSIHLYAGG